ncbi:MFS transporter [Paenibacillus amylolyticus]|uniref:MFS transporter n=1 Tax=Paenibacillus amylolyticus TaxID=1451 RepID=UPI00201E55F8|nr:MFS transporter [Paenibacillus amylolyticus]
MEQYNNKTIILNINKWKISLFVFFALSGMAFSSWTSRTPEVRDILHASTSIMGWIIFGIAAGAIVGLVSASSVIRHIGARKTIALSVIILSLGLLIAGFSILLAIKLLVFSGLVVFGLGYGIIDVAQNVEGAALERSTNKTLLPALHASFSGGTLLGVGLGSLAISVKIPVFIHFIIIAFVIILFGVICIKYLPTATGKVDLITNHHSVSSPQTKVSIFKELRLVYIGIIVMGMALAEGTANDWLPILFVDAYQVTHVTGTIVYGVFLLAMLIGRMSGGFLLDRFGRVPILVSAAIIAVSGLAVVILDINFYFAAAGVFLWGIGASLGFPVGLSAAGDNPNGATERVAFVSTLGYLAFLVGPPFIGLLGESVGLLYALLVVIIAVLIAGLFSPAAKKIETKSS